MANIIMTIARIDQYRMTPMATLWELLSSFGKMSEKSP